jgi:hypothetical protein
MMGIKTIVTATFILFALLLSAGAQTITGKVVGMVDGGTITVIEKPAPLSRAKDAANRQRLVEMKLRWSGKANRQCGIECSAVDIQCRIACV